MSVRSELRVAALERDVWSCRWPGCETGGSGNLEMCHLNQLSQGGPDVLENVVMLCRFHHGVLDNRVQNGRREAVRVLLEAFVRRNQW